MSILDIWKQPVLYTWTRENGTEVIKTYDGAVFKFKSIEKAKIWLSGFEKAYSIARTKLEGK